MRAVAHYYRRKGENMKEIFLKIKCTPVQKSRPKFTTINGYPRSYTPKKTHDFESLIAQNYVINGKGVYFEREEPIHVTLVFGMPIPKTTPKSRRMAMLNGILKPIRKPDIDNLAKAVLDALNKVAWADDAQIARLLLSKEYTDDPYISIYIHEIKD